MRRTVASPPPAGADEPLTGFDNHAEGDPAKAKKLDEVGIRTKPDTRDVNWSRREVGSEGAPAPTQRLSFSNVADGARHELVQSQVYLYLVDTGSGTGGR
ncbi:hypothetical protein ACH4XT_02660 [Streptomyces avidinii]|uniref:hypothetical protein n=1 Tax=Streptomyces avidinii TaxID=1895 RepID=UPI003789296D